jgi:hypothetical protein
MCTIVVDRSGDIDIAQKKLSPTDLLLVKMKEKNLLKIQSAAYASYKIEATTYCALQKK